MRNKSDLRAISGQFSTSHEILSWSRPHSSARESRSILRSLKLKIVRDKSDLRAISGRFSTSHEILSWSRPHSSARESRSILRPLKLKIVGSQAPATRTEYQGSPMNSIKLTALRKLGLHIAFAPL